MINKVDVVYSVRTTIMVNAECKSQAEEQVFSQLLQNGEYVSGSTQILDFIESDEKSDD